MPQAHQLGRYQLLDRIAFGGMAEIYRAKTFDADGRARLVAVKRVLQHLTQDEDFIRMLVDEAKVTAILDHPGIARVYEFSQAGDEYFIAMEFVDGKDVRAILEKLRQSKTQMPIEHAVWIIAHVADGLNAAHTQVDADGKPMQIVHRDVSPSNILCSYQGDAKLCDFGIAKATLTRVQTRTGVIKGKVKYMSPEQAMGRKLDGRSDLFSLGSCLYELLTLEPPFIAPTEVELIFAVRDAKKRDPKGIRPDLPAPLVAILDRVMQRQRSDRFQSGRELSRELYGFLEKNFPNYKRGALGRYIRELFKDEIERDLRQLESWVIEQGDASRVGKNLIADVMPEDAPYLSFSPASSVSVSLVPVPDDQPAPADLHALPTQIVAGKPRTRAELHAAATLMLEGRQADGLRAQLLRLHEQETKLLADAPPATITEPSGETDLPPQPTVIVATELPKKAAAPPPVPPAKKKTRRTAHDTAPDAPRGFDEDAEEATVPRKGRRAQPTDTSTHVMHGAKVIADFSSEDSAVTNPLADTDLEES